MSLFRALIGIQDNSTMDLTELFNGHGAVDLGLTADNGNHLLIATCNVGASKPEEYGDYFMWGSTTPNNTDKCYWDDCPYHTGTSQSKGWTKYIPTGKESYGTPDNKTVLDPEDDAAHVIMGGNWRMPTRYELSKLGAKSNVWTTLNGIYGRKWTFGNYTLFIPAAGNRGNGSFYGQESFGYIWSSSLYTSSPYRAYNIGFTNISGTLGVSYTYRYTGFSVRGVIELTDAQYKAWLKQNK